MRACISPAVSFGSKSLTTRRVPLYGGKHIVQNEFLVGRPFFFHEKHRVARQFQAATTLSAREAHPERRVRTRPEFARSP